MPVSSESKIKSREHTVSARAEWASQKKVVGYTSGVFDLLHPGHVDYLEKARSFCDVLIVGVNSDCSVRQNKGAFRPICGQDARTRVVAALQCVDAVFIFDETNNNKNIELLKPDVYLKAGDYSKQSLTSAAIVESYGGRVQIVPLLGDFSSTAIIESILDKQLGAELQGEPKVAGTPRPAVFVDRDGTIIEHVDYLFRREDVRPIPGALAGLRKLAEAGYLIVVVTNQPGLGLGMFKFEDFVQVTREFLKNAARAGVPIHKIYFCPHTEADACACRKPEPLLIQRAVDELGIDLGNSFVIGDMTIDVMLGKNAGCRSILVGTGHGGKDGRFAVEPDFEAADLNEAATLILSLNHTSRTLTANSASPRLLGTYTLEAIGQAAGRIGHDFNNFLGAIRGCADMMKRKLGDIFPDGSPVDRQIALIDSSIAKSIDLTNKLRGFVRPGPIVTNRHRLAPLLQRVRQWLTEHGVEVVLEVKDDPEVEMNEFSIEQVLIALGLNAVEAMSEIKDRDVVIYLDQIEVQSKHASLAAGCYARISVVDHGPGLASEELGKVFTPFFSTKPPTPGRAIGLSLAMAREVLRKHRGAITIQSQPGCGTNVQVFLPLSELPPGPVRFSE